MKITSIASSSKGNSYLIESNGHQLLIDVGVPLKKIRERLLNGSFKNVVGCLVSHEHADHAGYLGQLERQTSIPIYCTEGTKKRFSLSGMCQTLRHKEKIIFNGGFDNVFEVIPLKLSHDVECFGFLITNYKQNLLYATDTESIDYCIHRLNILMIECNYSFELLIQSEQNKSVVQRICNTHLSIDQVEEFVRSHPDLVEIHLLHLSSSNSDEKEFKERIQSIAGCVVKVAGE